MNLVIGFSPFILFALLSRLSADLALWAAFAAGFVVTVRDFVESPSLRLLDAGSLVLFCLLAFVRGFLDPAMPLAAVRFIADAGLFLLLLVPLLLGRPFSVDYARLDPKEAQWPAALFLRVNILVSSVWVLAFAVMAAVDGAITFSGGALQLTWGIAANVLALGLAATFTLRYPEMAARTLPRGE